MKEVKVRRKLEFPDNLVSEPVLYEMAKTAKVVYSVRRADVKAGGNSYIILDLSGELGELQKARAYLVKKGIAVNVVSFKKRTQR